MTRAGKVEIRHDSAVLHGDLVLPEGSGGLVVFAHGSGSSRHSPRNRYVAERLQRDGLGTLVLDLLTEAEEAAERETGHLRFDVELLADRLVGTVKWLEGQVELEGTRIGYFGASTGAGAALRAAAQRPEGIGAVVSRGGRPDLAGDALPGVRAPTLLIVGGRDTAVIDLNREAHERLRCERRLEVVPGATHLFEERGALDQVANLAADWFSTHLVGLATPRPSG